MHHGNDIAKRLSRSNRSRIPSFITWKTVLYVPSSHHSHQKFTCLLTPSLTITILMTCELTQALRHACVTEMTFLQDSKAHGEVLEAGKHMSTSWNIGRLLSGMSSLPSSLSSNLFISTRTFQVCCPPRICKYEARLPSPIGR